MRRAYQFQQKIDNILELTRVMDENETKSAMAKYLCILVSGYLELNMKEIIQEYASKTSSPIIQNFIEYSIQGLTNLKAKKISESLERFNCDWSNKFQKELTEEQKDAVDSLVANRNSIAHGKDVGISYIRIKRYYEKTKEVVGLIESICL